MDFEEAEVKETVEETKVEKKGVDCQGISHPIAIFFHLLWKVLAVVTYTVVYYLASSDTLVLILLIIFLSFDFWTVKNVTGRLLVGLRWWNEVMDDGTSKWIYEGGGSRNILKTEGLIFWGAMLGFPLVWVLFGIISLFSFNVFWLFVVLIAFLFSLPNIYGYLRCAKETRSKLKKMASDYAGNMAKEYAAKTIKEQMMSSVSNFSVKNFFSSK